MYILIICIQNIIKNKQVTIGIERLRIGRLDTLDINDENDERVEID